MRSVVVVLPASMWAMIPMFLVFSSVYLRGIGFSLGLRSSAGMPARRAWENEPFGGLSPCATVSWLAPSRAEQHKPPRDRRANIAGGLALASRLRELPRGPQRRAGRRARPRRRSGAEPIARAPAAARSRRARAAPDRPR